MLRTRAPCVPAPRRRRSAGNSTHEGRTSTSTLAHGAAHAVQSNPSVATDAKSNLSQRRPKRLATFRRANPFIPHLHHAQHTRSNPIRQSQLTAITPTLVQTPTSGYAQLSYTNSSHTHSARFRHVRRPRDDPVLGRYRHPRSIIHPGATLPKRVQLTHCAAHQKPHRPPVLSRRHERERAIACPGRLTNNAACEAPACPNRVLRGCGSAVHRLIQP